MALYKRGPPASAAEAAEEPVAEADRVLADRVAGAAVRAAVVRTAAVGVVRAVGVAAAVRTTRSALCGRLAC